MRFSIVSFGLSAIGAALTPIDSASAQQAIGAAAAVVPAVTGSTSGTLAMGSTVYFNETIRTAAVGETRLEFLDKTKLTIGGGSAVKLDRFVYNPDGTASAFALTLTKGALRFVTGVSPKDAYEIHTPTATLGVRGTDFVLLVGEGFTSLKVDEGSVIACVGSTQAASTARRPQRNSCTNIGAGEAATLFSNGRITNKGTGLQGVDPGARIREAELLTPSNLAGNEPNFGVASARALASTLVTNNVSALGSVTRAYLPPTGKPPSPTIAQSQPTQAVISTGQTIQGSGFQLTSGDPNLNFSQGTSFGSIANNGQVITALNQADTATTTMTATFKMPLNQSTFSLSTLANFVTTEFPSFVGGPFNDNVTVTVIAPSGASQTYTMAQIYQASVNGSKLNAVTGLPAPLTGFNASNGGGQTGFQSVQYSTKAAPGGNVQVVVTAKNIGDTALPSAILLSGTKATAGAAAVTRLTGNSGAAIKTNVK